jgi:signal transduction histidine kinase
MRQLTHDLGNDLGALDLQAAYLAELVGSSQERSEMARLRSLVGSVSKQLQSVTALLNLPQLYLQRRRVLDCLEGFRGDFALRSPRESSRLSWDMALGAQSFAVDPELLGLALGELCRNACEFHQPDSPVNVCARAESGMLIWELHQLTPQVSGSPDSWGVAPFQPARRGHYGLGLFYARRVVIAHGGQLQFLRDSGSDSLVTRVMLPLAEVAG